MNRLFATWTVTLTLAAGLIGGCEKKDVPPPAPPAPKTGAAIDGSQDTKKSAEAATPAAPAGDAKKPVTAAELAASTPKVPAVAPSNAPGTASTAAPAAPSDPNATGEHASYQALLAQRQQTLDKPTKVIPGYEPVAFSDLTGFGYMPKSPTRADALKTKLETQVPLEEDSQIPTNIKALNGKKVALQGYMIPVDFEQGGTNDFLLVQVVPTCYFCQQPQPNEWVEVKTKDGKRIPYSGDDTIILTGTLDVGAKYKGGYFLSLFRMEADGVHQP
jgi:hypothetical protein